MGCAQRPFCPLRLHSVPVRLRRRDRRLCGIHLRSALWKIWDQVNSFSKLSVFHILADFILYFKINLFNRFNCKEINDISNKICQLGSICRICDARKNCSDQSGTSTLKRAQLCHSCQNDHF